MKSVMKWTFVPIVSVALYLPGVGFADTLVLRSGQMLQGTFLGGTPRQIRFESGGSVQNLDVTSVQSIAFGDSADVQTSANSMMVVPDARPVGAPMGDGVFIPADTAILIRMVDSVNSDTARPGQTFMASLDAPIMIDGRTIVPRGADVMTKIVADQNAGRLQGRTVLTLSLVSVKVKDNWVDMVSTDVRTESSSQGAKSAKAAGATAALGAVIGGLVGGGKGAAIGAGSGAAVGAGAAAITSGEKVTIPSETRLTFRLQTGVRL